MHLSAWAHYRRLAQQRNALRLSGLRRTKDNRLMDQLVATPSRQLDLNLTWSNSFAQLGPAFYTEMEPKPLPSPYLVGLNRRLAAELGLSAELLAGPEGVEAFTGN